MNFYYSVLAQNQGRMHHVVQHRDHPPRTALRENHQEYQLVNLLIIDLQAMLQNSDFLKKKINIGHRNIIFSV